MDRSLVSLAMMAIVAAPLVVRAGDGSPYYPSDPGQCAACDASGACGGGFNQAWHRFCTDFHRNNSWPEPFLTADRMAVRTPW